MVNTIKSKKGGVVGDLITGTGALIILTVIVLIIVSTIIGANLLGSDDTTAGSGTNEVGYINSTAYQLGTAGANKGTYAITGAVNYTDGTTILAANYTLDADAGTVVAAGATTYDNVTFNYTFVITDNNVYENTSNFMAGNLTTGINNVSTKIPTILLIAAVVLLFGIIVLLMRQAGAMGIGGDNGSL